VRVTRVDRIVLIGFSGTGKTTVARLLADRLCWSTADSDDEIERQWGMTTPEIFRDHGEVAFRESERSVLQALCGRDRIVVATGGGAVVDPTAWSEELLGRRGTIVFALDAEPETILSRLQRQAALEGEDVERPLLNSPDPLGRIFSLKAGRQAVYDAAHLTLPVDFIEAEHVAAELALLTETSNGQPLRLRLDAASGGSDVTVGCGLLPSIGAAIRQEWPKAQRAWIVTDSNVGPLHGETATNSLVSAGFSVSTYAVRAGEGSKSLRTTGELFDWLLNGGVERGDVVIALGGGVVGDLAGFAAATVLRGIGLVQVPTTLLAAVDSSVGGKTGINHAAGKNLIGAFYQPRLVIVDTELLKTLPPRELRSGWGEVVKHAIIQRSTPGGERRDLATFLRRNVQRLEQLEEPVISYLIWRNIALKAAVVAADERETGIRAFLNFGHTLGHAIEAADYQLLHGEAVAVGMHAASVLGVLHGTCRSEEATRIRELIGAFKLPHASSFDERRVLALTRSDKKRIAGKQRYVLPTDGGGVVLRDDVSELEVEEALASVNSLAAAR
jgi:shikimate kinase / 3-dehydroquinate synthase